MKSNDRMYTQEEWKSKSRGLAAVIAVLAIWLLVMTTVYLLKYWAYDTVSRDLAEATAEARTLRAQLAAERGRPINLSALEGSYVVVGEIATGSQYAGRKPDSTFVLLKSIETKPLTRTEQGEITRGQEYVLVNSVSVKNRIPRQGDLCTSTGCGELPQPVIVTTVTK